jgi:excisionase family DNA binding protein
MVPKMKKRTRVAHASAIYTPSELARVLGISRNGVYAALRNGTIPHVRIGRRFVIPKTAVKSWLATIAPQMSRTGGIH